MIHYTRRVSKLKNSFLLIFLIGISVLTLSNCSESGSEDESTPIVEVPWEGDPSSVPPKLQKTNPVASPDAKKGGNFRVYAHQFPKSLNYYLDQFSTTATVFTSLYETLTQYDPLTLEVIPNLASSWTISPDKKTFTFEIDKNAKWSDGKPVTAEDVLFTYDTIMNKNNNTAVFRIGLSRFEVPKLIGANTISFTAKTVHWNNFNEVASSLWILPKHYFAGKDFNKQNFEFGVVSGPYKLKEAKKNRYIKLERRGDYWARAYEFNKQRFNFDYITMKVYNEEAVALQAFKKGDIDFYPVYSAAVWVEEAKGKPFEQNYIHKLRIFNEKPVGFQGWAMNSRKEIFADKKTRKAIAHLVDRNTMIAKLAFGEYAPTNSYYPDFYLITGKTPNEEVDYSLEKARTLLKEAGWKPNAKGILERNGKEFRFTILDRDKRTEKYFTVFLERAKELGIAASIETTDLAAWSQRIDSYDFDMTWAAWGSGINKDPEPQWSSEFVKDKGGQNLPGLSLPQVDALVQKQKTEFDWNKRNGILKEIDVLIYREYPYVLLWHLDNTRILYWRKFGFPKNPLGKYGTESFAYDYWYFDSEKAKTLKSTIDSDKPMDALEPVMRYQN